MSIQTIAIIIGVSYYLQDDIAYLPAAEIDAVNFARALKNWGIPEKNILILLNHEVNKKNVDTFLNLLKENKENFKLVFYFCGHGHRSLGKNPRSYLVFHDSRFEKDECLDSFSLDLPKTKGHYNQLEADVFLVEY